MIDRIEDLNLTWEVRDGIVCHTGGRKADTPEGRDHPFRGPDRSNMNHDIDDAIRGGLIRAAGYSVLLLDSLGDTHGRRIDTMVTAMISYGQQHREIGMDEKTHHEALVAPVYVRLCIPGDRGAERGAAREKYVAQPV